MIDKVSALTDFLEKRYRIKIPKRRDVLEVFIKTILSQNTNDLNRDRAYENLRKRYKTWEELRRASLKEIQETIKEAGLPKQKARTIKRLLNKIYKKWGSFKIAKYLYQMEKDEFMNFFLSIKGIGIKTASVSLLFGCGKPAFPVDTHIYRVTKRIGLIGKKVSREKAHILLDAVFPDEKKLYLHLQLIEFGKEICKARTPLCHKCGISSICEFYNQSPNFQRTP